MAVKWYGLAYMAGLLLGWLYVKHLLRQARLWPNDKAPFTPDRADDLLLFMTVGVLVGGRLGYVLFYEPAYYFNNPLEILAVWKGGMSFHGGLIGSIIAIVLFRAGSAPTPGACSTRARPQRRSACSSGGSPTSSTASSGPADRRALGHGVPARAPCRAIRASSTRGARGPRAVRGAVVAGARAPALRRPGVVAGTFLAGYAVARSFCELFREPDFLLGTTSAR